MYNFSAHSMIMNKVLQKQINDEVERVGFSQKKNEIESQLRVQGYSAIGRVLTVEECGSIVEMYESADRFRSRIDMARFRFGKGEYKYFAYPLPEVVDRLRAELYAGLSGAASRWMSDLGEEIEYPPMHKAFAKQCHEAGQIRPTPLILRYGPGDFNCLHQDLYGDFVFPFQVVIGLSKQGSDYTGGELMLVEQQPRAQSIGRVVPLDQGEGVVITTRYRPVKGSRGFYRTNVRHGVSPLRSGRRFTLGIIFHDSK